MYCVHICSTHVDWSWRKHLNVSSERMFLQDGSKT